MLWAGDTLEVRGARADYVQVYDHRRERAGYVRASQVRELGLAEADASGLLAIVRFLRDTPGSEALGIGYGAAYLKAAPAPAVTAEPFDAIGQMADRLARRASSAQQPANATALAAHLEVVRQYGITMASFERHGVVQVCYDGEMFRRALAQPGVTPEQAARAALGLTRPECIDPSLTPAARYDLQRWQAQVLDRVPVHNVSEPLRSRVHLRRAGVWAALAFDQVRRGEPAASSGERSIAELSGADRNELGDEDLNAYAEAAIRVGASRWAATPVPAAPGGLVVRTTPGAPGQTCVSLYKAGHESGDALATRCTYGTVWTASAASNPGATALSLAVQPLESWRELWVFRHAADGWRIDVLPPASQDPELGYVEFAGWVPGGERLLVARDVRTPAGAQRRFEVVRLDTLETEHQASSPQILAAFIRWQDPAWRRDSVTLR